MDSIKFCDICGRILGDKGKCKYTHKPKQPKQQHYRGTSKFAKEQGYFKGLNEN